MASGHINPKPSKHPWLGSAINLALVGLAFALLGLVLWQNRAEIRQVFARPLDLRLLVLGIIIFQFSLLITYVRWYTLVKVIEPRFTLRSTMLLGFIGYVFNLVIPGAVGGDFIKAAYLVRMHVRKTQAVASMVIDRIVGLLGLFVLAAVAGAEAWAMASSDVRKLILASWIMTGLGFLALAVIFTQAISRFFPGLRSSRHSRLGLIMTELSTMSSTYRRRLDVVFGALALSVLGHTLNVLAFYLMGKMLFPEVVTPSGELIPGMTTSLGEHFLMVPLTLFTMVVPLPFGALGVSEGVGKQIGKLVNHPNGALAMLGFRVLMYACGLIAACVYLFNIREVRSLTASAHRLEEEMAEGELVEDENADKESTIPPASGDKADEESTAPAIP
jgi:uncharacterized membrane protein YbhN (UPF0104 family)